MTSTVLEVGAPDGAALTSNQAARRQRIVDVASAMLEEREFERIQVKDVADGASVALGTLYRYFSSKEHLFGEVLVQWAGSLGSAISRRAGTAPDPAARLESVLHRSVRAFERQPQLAKLVGRLEMSEDPFAIDVVNRLGAITDEVYLAALEQIDPDEAARVVHVLDAVLDSTLRAWSVGRLPIGDVYRLLSDAIDLVLPGHRASPERRRR